MLFTDADRSRVNKSGQVDVLPTGHVVFVPKRRRKAIFGPIRRQLGAIFHALAKQKECQILEGHLMPDHVHMCIAIPPKHPVASVIGFLKGKRHCHRPAGRKGEKLLR